MPAPTTVEQTWDFLTPQVQILAALGGFVDIPNRGSAPDQGATSGFVEEARLPWFAWFDQP
jgi:hypothetical protein